jgi:hypothetical protein
MAMWASGVGKGAVPYTERLGHFRATVIARLHVVEAAWRHRRGLPLLGVVGAPLAMVAAAGCGVWWTWVPLLLFAYGCIPSSRVIWLLAFEEAIVGLLWVSVGVNAFQAFPSRIVVVAIVWAVFPMTLAIVGHCTHRRFGE